MAEKEVEPIKRKLEDAEDDASAEQPPKRERVESVAPTSDDFASVSSTACTRDVAAPTQPIPPTPAPAASTSTSIPGSARTDLYRSDEDSGSDSSMSSSVMSQALNVRAGLLKRSKINVLVVDDSAAVRKITKAKLEEAGYTVDIAANGQEALSALTTHPAGHFNIVLCDIYMPILDGVRFANIVREREAQAGAGDHQIIIGLSAETRDITADIMDSCLLKPFDLESFEACVRLFHVG